MDKIVVIGCGGHAKSVIDVIVSSGKYELSGIIKPHSEYPVKTTSPECIGTYDDFEKLVSQGLSNFIAAIGDNRIRKDVFHKAVSAGMTPVNVLSSFCYVSNDVKLGNGIFVMHGAVINSGTTINDNCIINTNASVDHDCFIEKHGHVCPGSVLAGSVFVDEGALLGAGCTILPEITIGAWSICGAGSVVTKNVDSHDTVISVSARSI